FIGALSDFGLGFLLGLHPPGEPVFPGVRRVPDGGVPIRLLGDHRGRESEDDGERDDVAHGVSQGGLMTPPIITTGDLVLKSSRYQSTFLEFTMSAPGRYNIKAPEEITHERYDR